MKLIKIIALGSILFSLKSYSRDNLFKKFYINGMNVTEEESKESLFATNEYLAKNEVEKYDLFYNPTGNKKQSGKIEVRKPFEDLNEVFYQKHREYLKEKQWKEKIVRDYIKMKFAVDFYNDHYKQRSMKFIKDKLNTNQYFLLISHSQGNLVTNQTCDYLEEFEKHKYDRIYNFGFGVPANNISCSITRKSKSEDSYVTFALDYVINALRAASLINFPDKSEQPLSPNLVAKNNKVYGLLSNHGMKNYAKNQYSRKYFKDHFYTNFVNKFDLNNKIIAEYKHQEKINLDYQNPKLTKILSEIQKCQDQKVGCNLDPYKDKVSFGSNTTSLLVNFSKLIISLKKVFNESNIIAETNHI